MDHLAENLTQITWVVLAALCGGVMLERLNKPAILGYILAGVLLGPSLFGLIEDRALVSLLAELGVLMLLFLIGLELSLDCFKKVLTVSVCATLLQIGASLLIVFGLGALFNWGTGLCLVLAFSMALSSTAICVKMLESSHELDAPAGRLTIGVLIAQDLAVVPMILTLRGLQQGINGPVLFFKIGLALLVLGVLIWYLSRRDKLTLPFSAILRGHDDLLPLVALIFCFGCAALSGAGGLSAAYGAFIGGLILGNTTEKDTIIQSTRPIQAVLLMVFFLSIGLLIDLKYIWENIWKILFFLFLITIGKSFGNIFIFRLLKRPWQESFLAGIILSQMGEFSFLIATLGTQLSLVPESTRSMIISLAALSLAFSPIWLACARRLHDCRTENQTFSDAMDAAYGPFLRAGRPAVSQMQKIWARIASKDSDDA